MGGRGTGMDAFSYLSVMVSIVCGHREPGPDTAPGEALLAAQPLGAFDHRPPPAHVVVVLDAAGCGRLELCQLRLRADRARGARDREPHHHPRAARGPDRRRAALFRYQPRVLRHPDRYRGLGYVPRTDHGPAIVLRPIPLHAGGRYRGLRLLLGLEE